MRNTLTSVDPALDVDAIFTRGFVTIEESEAVDLSSFSSKVRLLDKDGNGEGIWLAFITEEDKALYDGNTKDQMLCGILVNHALCFIPNPTWGRVLKGKTNGTARPIFLEVDNLPRLKDTHVAYVNEYTIRLGKLNDPTVTNASNITNT